MTAKPDTVPFVLAQATSGDAEPEAPADAPAAETSETVGVAEQAPEGANFPPFDTSTFAPQLVWLAITFVALYLLMSRVALPRIATVIEQRRDRIAHDLEEAERSKLETEKAIEHYETALAEARAKAHQIAQANRDKLNAEIDAERSRMEATIATKTADAEVQITAAKEAALAELGTVATDVTEEILKELVGGRWAKGKITSAVGTEIKG